MTTIVAKEQLFIELYLPNKYLSSIEVEINSSTIVMNDVECSHME